ncbi:MAG: hypothetical protein ABI333_21375 [bacterium]
MTCPRAIALQFHRIVWLAILLLALVGCEKNTGVGPGSDAAGNTNSSDAATGSDGALPDAAQVADAVVDAWVRPPGDAYVLPENPYDAFVHPGPQFGPAMVINTLALENGVDGLGPFASVVNSQIQDAVDLGQLLMVIEILDLNSTTGVINDADVMLVLYRAQDADANPANNFTGAGHFLVQVDTATVIAGASISGGSLLVPAGSFPYLSVEIPGLGELVVINPEIAFTVLNDLAGFTNGTITGAVPSRTLDLLPNESGFGNPNGTVLDLLAASIFDVQPDVDIDGDGQLEVYEDQSPSNPTLDESISICFDYFGTFESDDCPQFPEIWDGYSINLEFTAVPATIDAAF